MIAVFDSGVGGISVLREIRRLLPQADIVYFGDSAHAPYGDRTDQDIIDLSLVAMDRLRAYHPQAIVVACNTATSIAIQALRQACPEVPIIGVVPVLKTVAEKTTGGRAAVLATRATLNSSSYQALKKAHVAKLKVLELALPEWVTFVESGLQDENAIRLSVAAVAREIAEHQADVVALGCTHFPYFRDRLQSALPNVLILDSGPAVARQVVRVLEQNNTLPGTEESGHITWLTSGDNERFSALAERLIAF